MANEEHLAILRQGVEAWNRWRHDDRGIVPNLSGAILSGAILSKADFFQTNLNGAVLSGVILSGADLSGANLSGAILSGAILSRANLLEANLSGAVLIEANLTETVLTLANLCKTNLRKVDLTLASLSRTHLQNADLSGSDISGAEFVEADLSHANLSRTQALGTNFMGAMFTGICLDDWNINSDTILDDIHCRFVYLKKQQRERRPSSGEFAPGEFTKLFQKALSTIDLIFSDGIDWAAFFQSFQKLQAEYGQENLAIQAIEKKSGSAFVIRLEVSPDADKAIVEQRAKELYEIKLFALEQKLSLQSEQLAFYREQVAIERQKSTDLLGVIQTVAENSIRNIQTGGGAYYESINTGGGNYIQGNYLNLSQDLTQAAAQIQDLLNQLQKQGVTVEVAQQQVANDIATQAQNNPTMMGKLTLWGQSLANDVAKTTIGDVVKGTVKLALKTAGIPLP
jgi:uncharacterized protein YjbI with pentapeptide repeats